ncbi:hypothetical protein PILCRDRAFT_227525 [Piloderma croceum F 1598]|uniref:Uncharacterized protein n=1 Tax=Piloderma croceum (strain F 1598) TaxID=765440 RepID=A0A0C3BSK8_PILCF|nr:hypothetical protein PILCRDRAFT_227525 [Piloderma croceum F 1598]
MAVKSWWSKWNTWYICEARTLGLHFINIKILPMDQVWGCTASGESLRHPILSCAVAFRSFQAHSDSCTFSEVDRDLYNNTTISNPTSTFAFHSLAHGGHPFPKKHRKINFSDIALRS